MLATNDDWDNLQKDIENDKKTAEVYLLHYPDRLKEYRMRKAGALAKRRNDSGGGGGSMPGAPTEQAAVASISYDERHDEYYWLKAVEVVQRVIGERKSIFLACRREADRRNSHARGQKPWVITTQMLFVEALGERFFDSGQWVSERTVRRYWRDIISKVANIHLRLKK